MSWRTIPGLPMYEASDSGLIRSKARTVTAIVNGRRVRKVLSSKLLAQSLMTLNGKPHYATAKVNGQTLYVHRLVAMAWHADTYFAGAEVNHINGNPRDNRADNLEWVTHRQNILHSYRTLQTPRKRPQTGHGRRLDHGRRKAWHPVKGA
ncbi:MAG: HNH endonuclease signature motif containing protein [Desulfobacterales bacterium]|jgi:glycyl-tRNA synthetase beta subunit